jgi:hypothetical protein
MKSPLKLHTHVHILLSSYGVECSTIDKMSFNIKGSELPLNKVLIWSPKPRDKFRLKLNHKFIWYKPLHLFTLCRTLF